MIRLIRVRTDAAIPEGLRGVTRRQRELMLLTMWRNHLRTVAKKSPRWNDAWWKTGKGQLKQESHGKCAYCESPTDVVAHGDVEHFRPKSKYWWLAYCYDNHLFACQICNQSHKGDKFPIAGDAMKEPRLRRNASDSSLEGLVDTFAPDPLETRKGHPLSAFLSGCRDERPGLPDPYNENPEDYFCWEADSTNKEVWIRARSGAHRHRKALAAVEGDLGLNREILRRWRWTLGYKPLLELRDILVEADSQRRTSSERQTIVNAIMRRTGAEHPYAAMARYFVTQWRIA